MALYVKGGGKNGRHASQSEAFKVYEHVCGRQFSNHGYEITLPYSSLRNPSLARLLVEAQGHSMKTANSSSNMEIELTEQDWEVYKQLDASKAKLAKVMVLSRKKNKAAWSMEESEG